MKLITFGGEVVHAELTVTGPRPVLVVEGVVVARGDTGRFYLLEENEVGEWKALAAAGYLIPVYEVSPE